LDLVVLSRHLQPDQDHEAERIKAMMDLVDGIICTVRRVASELRPGIVDYLGLPGALEWQTQDFSCYTGIQTSPEVGKGSFNLSRDAATAFLRIFQELKTHIARHALTTRVKIKSKNVGDRVILTVQDNGMGIISVQVANPRSFGIIGMRERALAVNGEFTVHKAPAPITFLISPVNSIKSRMC
jgi:signal transduction histidine kinase